MRVGDYGRSGIWILIFLLAQSQVFLNAAGRSDSVLEMGPIQRSDATPPWLIKQGHVK